MKNLTAEERKFITQNPALLEFILNQKRESTNPGNCCEEEVDDKADCEPSSETGFEPSCEPNCVTSCESRKRCLDDDDQSSTAPVTPIKLPKLSETDSGLNSINSSSPKEEPKPIGLSGLPGLPGQTIQQDRVEESAEGQKSPKSSEADDVDPNEEVKSEDAAEIIENANPEELQNPEGLPSSQSFPGLPGLGPLNQMRPHVRNFLQQSAAMNSAAASNTPNSLFAGLQNQILQAAIQRQKLEEEQKRMIHPAFRQPIPNPLSAHLFPFGHVSTTYW